MGNVRRNRNDHHMRLPQTRKSKQLTQRYAKTLYTRSNVHNLGKPQPVVNKEWSRPARTGLAPSCLGQYGANTWYVSPVLRLPTYASPSPSSPLPPRTNFLTASRPTTRYQERVVPSATGVSRKSGLKIGRRQVGSRKLPFRSRNLKSQPGAFRLIYLVFNHHNTVSNHGLQIPNRCLRTASSLRPINSRRQRRQRHPNRPRKVQSTSILQLSSSLHHIRVRMLFHPARSRQCSLATQMQREWSTMETQMFRSIYLTRR